MGTQWVPEVLDWCSVRSKTPRNSTKALLSSQAPSARPNWMEGSTNPALQQEYEIRTEAFVVGG